MSSVVADIQAEFPEIVKGDFSSAVEKMWDEDSLIMDEDLRQNIELAQGKKMKAKAHVRLCSCPPVLKALGEKDVDVVTEARILWKIANTHKLSAEETEKALRGMEFPLFVIKDSARSYIFVPGMLAANGKNGLSDVEVPLALERTKDGKHYVMSAYALDSLEKIETILNGGGKLVYSRYSKAALSTNGVQGVTPDFIRLMVERGFNSDTIIETEDVKSDFSSAMAYIDEEQITRPLRDAGRSFRGNEAFVRQMLHDAPEIFKRLGRTIRQWFEPIIRMWRFSKSNGITEGFHRKMKLIQRRAYGYRNFKNYRLRVLIECGHVVV